MEINDGEIRLTPEQEALAESYMRYLNVPERKTAKQYFVGLIGSYGVGKTTTSRKIAERLPFVIFSSDDLKRFMEREGSPPEVLDNNRIIFSMGLYVLRAEMKSKINVIIDADLREPYFREPLKKYVESLGYTFLLIHIDTDDNVAMERVLERRKSEESKWLRENLDRHFKYRKEIHASHPLPPDIFFTLKNNDRLDEQIDELVDKMKKELDLS